MNVCAEKAMEGERRDSVISCNIFLCKTQQESLLLLNSEAQEGVVIGDPSEGEGVSIMFAEEGPVRREERPTAPRPFRAVVPVGSNPGRTLDRRGAQLAAVRICPGTGPLYTDGTPWLHSCSPFRNASSVFVLTWPLPHLLQVKHFQPFFFSPCIDKSTIMICKCDTRANINMKLDPRSQRLSRLF